VNPLLSLNVGKPREVDRGGEKIATGIFKEPVDGRVALRATNLDGDGQADLSVHGGIHKAVYVYSFDHYAFWREELGRDDLRYGQFGENFSVAGWTDDQVHIGDVFRVGTALLEVTQPRAPCFNPSASSRAGARGSTCGCSRRARSAREMRWSGSASGRRR